MKYIGCQDDLMIYVANTKEELENLPHVELTEIKQVEFAELYNGVIYIDSAELQAAKEKVIRVIRDQYLVKYVDAVVSNPLRWVDMSLEEQTQITDYRIYLLDYTETENWWEHKPLDWSEYVQGGM